MVISVDTGNKMIKTEHYEFNSGIDVLDTIPGENDEVIEFGGKYYRTTNRRISYMEDKTEDDRYYILTLIAIAKELDTMKKEAVLAPNELIEIELLVGLPPAHYGKYRKKFQQYFQRDGKVVGFKYGGTSYQILIHEVKVYVQAYAAYCVLAARRHLTELPKVLVIDIGGFTVDYMILRYGRLEKEHVDSLESGVICLYGRIRAAIRQKYSIALDEEDIDNIILGKNTGYMQELKERVREVTIDSYMASLGVNLGRPAPGMGAAGAMLAASRIISQAARTASGSGGTGDVGGTRTDMGSSDGMTTNFTGPIPMTPNGGNAMDINDMTSDGDFDKESPPGPGNQQNEVSPANKTVFEELGMTTGSSDTAEMDFGSGDHVNGNIDSMSATSETRDLAEP